ncbi:MAG: WXG100 family type VII secretion target [Mycobacteriales bacterium]
MGSFNATPAQLHARGSAIAGIGDELHPELARLTGKVEGLLGGGWTGGAASGFGQGWVQWHQGAVEAMAALTELARRLGVSGQKYQATDDAAQAGAAKSDAAL